MQGEARVLLITHAPLILSKYSVRSHGLKLVVTLSTYIYKHICNYVTGIVPSGVTYAITAIGGCICGSNYVLRIY